MNTTTSNNEEPIKLADLNANNIKLSDLSRLPQMTGWFEVLLLLRLILRVIVSDLFGQYADRRLIEAALDPADKPTLIKRAQEDQFQADDDGAMWIDYVSDLGDGFDATYAIACLLAQPTLKVGEQETKRGNVLVMGGDEVYPTAERDDYKVKMRLPYDLAWPVPREQANTPLYLLPGNHDWYDGLVNFLAIFCREKGKEIGGWKTRQRRSYFAVQISEQWWLWGIDIALVRDMDQPQADYFEAIASAMAQGSNIILCSAEPGWYSAEAQTRSYKSLSYAALIARRADKKLNIPLVLSGDSHHYARYEGDNTHYITSGGGGAFLHGTLELKPKIDAKWLRQPAETLTLKSAYPTKEDSRKLLAGTAQFRALNPGLCWVLAGSYLLLSFLFTSVPRCDVAFLVFGILFLGIWGYSRYQEKSAAKTCLPSLLHAGGHFAVIMALSVSALLFGSLFTILRDWHWFFWLVVLALPAAAFGPHFAGAIFGASLRWGCKYFDISHNDAFSSMRLDSHRHFLRIKLQKDIATVYPIKLDQVPKRGEWAANEARASNAAAPVFLANMKPSLIEGPLLVTTKNVVTTTDVAAGAGGANAASST